MSNNYNVTNPNIQKVIFCEGKKDGPDDLVFTALFGTNPEVKPTGTNAIKRFAQGHYGGDEEYNKARENKLFFIIRDRDLDQKSPDGKLQLLHKTSDIYLTGVTTIECYFLDATLLQKYADTTTYATQISKELFQQTLESALNKLKKYQAIRWALQDIREHMMKKAVDAKLIRTATLDLPNTLPNKPKHNFDKTESELINEAQAQIRNLGEVIKYLGESTIGELETKYQYYQSLFSQFSIQTDEYKYWFHGKELMERWWAEMGATNLKINEYYRTCAPEIDFTRYPDLIEFRDICWGTK